MPCCRIYHLNLADRIERFDKVLALRGARAPAG